MKTLFRLFVVFGILDLIVVAIEFIGGYPISAKIILGLACLIVGIVGLAVLGRSEKTNS